MVNPYELREQGRKVLQRYRADKENENISKRKQEIMILIQAICECESVRSDLKDHVIDNALLWKWTEVPKLTLDIRYKFLNQRFWSIKALDALEDNGGDIEGKEGKILTIEHVYPRGMAASELVEDGRHFEQILKKMVVCVLFKGEEKGIPRGKTYHDCWLRYQDYVDEIYDMEHKRVRTIQDLDDEWQKFE